MGNCNSHLMCVTTEEDDFNYLLSICRMGNVYELMEVSLVNPYDLVHKYDRQGRQCTHIVATYSTTDAVMKMSLLVKMGADIHSRERRTGNNVLHIAVNRRHYELAEWLLQESKTIGDTINFMLQVPYHLAYYAGDKKMMELLKTSGAACDEPIISETSDGEVGD